jgi:hypothetical protein
MFEGLHLDTPFKLIELELLWLHVIFKIPANRVDKQQISFMVDKKKTLQKKEHTFANT